MITLYHRPRTRSSRFLWLLEELGAPYEIRRVTGLSPDGSGVIDPANPHPHGKVPAIKDGDDGTVVFESPAIVLYLTDKYPTAGIGPSIGDKDRGAYLSWLAYYTGVFEPAFMSKFMNTEVPVGSAGWVTVEKVMPFIIETLSKGPYLLGEKFSGADVLYATTFALFATTPVAQKSPVIEAYVKRALERPAYARAMTKDGGQ
ncbi:MAG TPA: glutathione S-transferase family protein [Rhizomicrobium sp.]|nr:glutathione S-transferase family protein [Rhizomicrobium sp.]